MDKKSKRKRKSKNAARVCRCNEHGDEEMTEYICICILSILYLNMYSTVVEYIDSFLPKKIRYNDKIS